MVQQPLRDNTNGNLSQGQQTGCNLANLSEEDKAKVVKLIRQVVQLEDELKVRRQRDQVASQQEALLKELQDSSKGTLQENAMLRTKLGQALALLRKFQHKVRAMEGSHMASQGHRQRQMQQLQGAKPAQRHEQHAAGREPEASTSGAQYPQAGIGCEALCARCSAALHPPSAEALLTEALLHQQGEQQHPGPAVERRDAVSQPCSTGMASSQAGGADGGPSPTALGTVSKPFATAGGPSSTSAPASESVGWAVSAMQDMDSCASQEGATGAAAAHVLRFDPAAGECGAFFILRAASRHAGDAPECRSAAAAPSDSAVVSQGSAPPVIDSAPSTASGAASHEQQQRGDSAVLRPCSSDLGEQCSEDGKHEQASGSAEQHSRWPGSEVASSRGLSCQRTFDSSLPDLVAQVEALVSSSSSGERTSAAGATWQHDYCRRWVGALSGGGEQGALEPLRDRGNDVLSLILEQEASMGS